MTGGLREDAAALVLAWQFLTRAPVLPRVRFTPERMAAAVPCFPVVGVLVGCVGAAVLLAGALILPMVPALLVSIAATCVLTGALHEDGLADTFDGIGGGRDRDRALAIMRDSRIGVFGALALGLVMALKVSALATMSPGPAAAALVAGQAASRLSVVMVIASSRYVRPEGAGGFTTNGVTARGLIVAGATGLLPLVVVACLAGAGAAVSGAAGLVAGHVLARGIFERRIGGYTGDCLGATQQISEAGLYLGIVAWL